MNKNPNVILINTDHWFESLMGVAGHQTVMTPTLNKLAKDGVRFTNCYSECPVCIPARRSLMTGTSPKTHGDRVYSDELEMPIGIPTMAEAFRNAGYQTNAVGKLHVYPQRNRIGFDDAKIMEEGRYEFGVVDDYQIWLGENGYLGEEFMHGMGNNIYYTRPWHLSEEAHPTNWVTREMIKCIKRKDPTRPAFYYLSYPYPHPPLVPLQSYLDMYKDEEIDLPIKGKWTEVKNYVVKALKDSKEEYTEKEILLAKKAFYAQCTHIDHQIRLIIGTLRECNLLDNTIIAFTSDHGDMLFDQDMVAKRSFYENAANIPLLISGKPLEKYKGLVNNELVCLSDIMPTLLDLCKIEIPQTVEGIPAFSNEKREMLYGEVSEGNKATRMAHDGRFKLIYYPVGNYIQLFDLKEDPKELKNIAFNKKYEIIQKKLEDFLIKNLYKGDLEWVKDSKLVGLQDKEFDSPADYPLYNQRGGHWPAPAGYKNIGANA